MSSLLIIMGVRLAPWYFVCELHSNAHYNLNDHRDRGKPLESTNGSRKVCDFISLPRANYFMNSDELGCHVLTDPGYIYPRTT